MTNQSDTKQLKLSVSPELKQMVEHQTVEVGDIFQNLVLLASFYASHRIPVGSFFQWSQGVASWYQTVPWHTEKKKQKIETLNIQKQGVGQISL